VPAGWPRRSRRLVAVLAQAFSRTPTGSQAASVRAVVLFGPPMVDANPERRSRSRIAVELPVAIKLSEGNVQLSGNTRDLSSNGIFFYTQARISEGSELEMVLILPPELTQGEKRWVCCQASVIRVEGKTPGREFGVAARIRRIEILPEIPQ